MKALETKLDRDDHAKGQMNFHKQMHGAPARGMEADLPPEEDAAEEEDEDEDDMEYYDKDEV